jgi:hypothetical protein
MMVMVMLSFAFYCYAECHNVESLNDDCGYAECHVFFTIMLRFIVLIVVMLRVEFCLTDRLSVIVLVVIMLSVAFFYCFTEWHYFVCGHV